MRKDYRVVQDKEDLDDQLKLNEMISFFRSEKGKREDYYRKAPHYIGTSQIVKFGEDLLGSTFEERKERSCIIVKEGLRRQEALELAHLVETEKGWMARVLQSGIIGEEQLFDVFFVKKMFGFQEKRDTTADILLAKKDYQAARLTYDLKAHCNMKKASNQIRKCIDLLEGIIEDVRVPLPELYAWLGLSYIELSKHVAQGEKNEVINQGLIYLRWYNHRIKQKDEHEYDLDRYERNVNTWLKAKRPIGQ